MRRRMIEKYDDLCVGYKTRVGNKEPGNTITFTYKHRIFQYIAVLHEKNDL